jgi:hypothetical protein
MDPAAIVLVWTRVALFVVTAIITIGGLLGWWLLGGGSARQHDYYLRNLFRALVVEIVAVVVGFFGLYIRNQLYQTQSATRTSIIQAQITLQENLQDRVTKLESSIHKLSRQVNSIQPSSAASPNISNSASWQLVRVGSDSGAHDVGSTDGAIPNSAQCKNGNISAVCWDGGLFVNLCRSGAWCAYKSLPPDQCQGGGSPGKLYRCIPG